jgi:hypothetical protein
MTIQREIVIEFEKVRTIRKRAATTLSNCVRCSAETDSVSIETAAELFEITGEDLFRFVRQNNCHFHVSSDGKTYLCVPSLLERMTRQIRMRLTEATGEKR